MTRSAIASLPRTLAAAVLCAAIALMPTGASAKRNEQVGYDGRPPGGYAMAVDGLIARPALLGMTAVGIAVFLVTLPFSAIGGNAAAAGEQLVVVPARATFTRCLGCVEPKQRALGLNLPEIEPAAEPVVEPAPVVAPHPPHPPHPLLPKRPPAGVPPEASF